MLSHMEHLENTAELAEFSVSDWLKTARERGELTQAAVARRAGCDRSTVSRIEDGLRVASPDMAGRLAQAIGELIAEKRRWAA